MSKQMCEKELETHCSVALAELEKALSDFRTSPVYKIQKRAMLIGYWLHTYVHYLRNEDTFDSRSVFRLKRGCIVRVEFGYRVGRELGGRHYAVVIDRENSIFRNTVTVIPLSSVKTSTKIDQFKLPLKDGIFGPVNSKLSALLKDTTAIAKEAEGMEVQIKEAPSEEVQSLRAVQRVKIDTAKKLYEQAKTWLDEISHMEQGTIANIGQITTISKMRISQPLQKTHPLYGLRLTTTDMNEIDTRIKELYSAKNTSA